MGLVGLLATVALMVVASWYMLAGPSSSNVIVNTADTVPATVENTDAVVPENTNTVSGAQALIGEAKGLKATLEQKAADINQQSTENSQQESAAITAEKKSSISIIDKKVSFGFSVSSGRKIDTVVLHSSYDALGSEPYSVSGTIKEYQEYGVAPHYLIDRKGAIYRLVDDKNIAYHAGESQMKDGRTGVNAFSIGIELLNKEDDQYTDAQYAAVNSLVAYLKDLYPIKSVVGHDDIAPGRKTDPWNFEWKKVQ
jgi:hypothetical protein